MAQGEKNFKKCKLMCHYCVKVADNDLPVVSDSFVDESVGFVYRFVEVGYVIILIQNNLRGDF